jgi:hypothetical protein
MAPGAAPVGALPNECKWSSSFLGAAHEAQNNFHKGGRATFSWLRLPFLGLPLAGILRVYETPRGGQERSEGKKRGRR